MGWRWKDSCRQPNFVVLFYLVQGFVVLQLVVGVVSNPVHKQHEFHVESEVASGSFFDITVQYADTVRSVLGSWTKYILRSQEEPSNRPELKLGWRTVCAVIFGAVGAILSSAGGVGGGGIFVPLFNLLLRFDTKSSAALSNVMILAGTFANLFWNSRQHHPFQKHRPLIDYDAALLLQPNMLLGISIGVILNISFPSWLITALLAITLSYIAILSFESAMKLWNKETQRALNSPQLACIVEVCEPHEVNEQQSGTKEGGTDDTCNAEKECVTGSLEEPLLLPESVNKCEHYPIEKLVVLTVVWLCFFVVQIVRGGKGSKSILNIKECGLGYWLITMSQIPLAIAVISWTICRSQRSAAVLISQSCQQERTELRLSKEQRLLPWMALLAGILGGLLGVGGGMIINPLLLHLGMCPQVVAATSAFMVFFSSSLSVLQFWLLGRIPLGYGAFAAGLCLIFSALGLIILQTAINKHGRPSFIVFCVSAVIGISAVLMAGFGSWDVWYQYQRGSYMGFHYPC